MSTLFPSPGKKEGRARQITPSPHFRLWRLREGAPAVSRRSSPGWGDESRARVAAPLLRTGEAALGEQLRCRVKAEPGIGLFFFLFFPASEIGGCGGETPIFSRLGRAYKPIHPTESREKNANGPLRFSLKSFFKKYTISRNAGARSKAGCRADSI